MSSCNTADTVMRDGRPKWDIKYRHNWESQSHAYHYYVGFLTNEKYFLLSANHRRCSLFAGSKFDAPRRTVQGHSRSQFINKC